VQVQDLVLRICIPVVLVNVIIIIIIIIIIINFFILFFKFYLQFYLVHISALILTWVAGTDGYCFSSSPSLTCISLKLDVYVYL